MIDQWLLIGLAPLAIWVVLSGLDDLFVNLAWVCRRVLERRGWRSWTRPVDEDLDCAPRQRIAVLVPLWRECRVIRGMVDHSVGVNRYDRFDIFAGAYPNDDPTLAAVRELEERYANVHLAVCPHDGPTSKADCLNWVFQRLRLYEEEHQVRFDVVVTHDAEDLIHPDSLRWINYYAALYDMVQVPVLPLPTPVAEWVHGVYCDEFAEFQLKELPARQFLGGFVPSCGVGTAYAREMLDKLASLYSNRIFEPHCLTEDYEIGFRVRRLGGRQLFKPAYSSRGDFIATREYFPRRFGAAVRQRTRWIMGIALQSWELHDWRETLDQLYWFWRDRKGLIGNLVSPLANALFACGLLQWLGSQYGIPLLPAGSSWLALVLWFTLGLQCVHLGVRTACSAKVYGWLFALGVPVRVLVSNWINCLATLCAIQRFVSARWQGRPLVWLKTDHAYPSRAALVSEHHRLGEILVGSSYIGAGELESALATQPPGTRLGEHLVRLGLLTEDELYEALSLQQNLAVERIDRHSVSIGATRALPAAVSRRWKVLPFRVVSGQLYVASPEVPSDEVAEELRRFCSLEIRFQLITPSEYAALEAEFLPKTQAAAAGY